MDRFAAAQASIDAIFENRSTPEEPATKRILKLAKRGVDAPEALTHKEMQQVCYALTVHYAQMGIE